eukprot:357754-Chlamydomonas_euryale.AAC.5
MKRFHTGIHASAPHDRTPAHAHPRAPTPNNAGGRGGGADTPADTCCRGRGRQVNAVVPQQRQADRRAR